MGKFATAVLFAVVPGMPFSVTDIGGLAWSFWSIVKIATIHAFPVLVAFYRNNMTKQRERRRHCDSPILADSCF
jgi:hypothetical protein